MGDDVDSQIHLVVQALDRGGGNPSDVGTCKVSLEGAPARLDPPTSRSSHPCAACSPAHIDVAGSRDRAALLGCSPEAPSLCCPSWLLTLTSVDRPRAPQTSSRAARTSRRSRCPSSTMTAGAWAPSHAVSSPFARCVPSTTRWRPPLRTPPSPSSLRRSPWPSPQRGRASSPSPSTSSPSTPPGVCISPYLPTSPHISPHLPTSPHISPRLHTSPHISPHVPTSPNIPPTYHPHPPCFGLLSPSHTRSPPLRRPPPAPRPSSSLRGKPPSSHSMRDSTSRAARLPAPPCSRPSTTRQTRQSRRCWYALAIRNLLL